MLWEIIDVLLRLYQELIVELLHCFYIIFFKLQTQFIEVASLRIEAEISTSCELCETVLRCFEKLRRLHLINVTCWNSTTWSIEAVIKVLVSHGLNTLIIPLRTICLSIASCDRNYWSHCFSRVLDVESCGPSTIVVAMVVELGWTILPLGIVTLFRQ